MRNGRIIVTAIAGNILEYYDFTVYSVFAVAIGKAFFPDASDLMQVLSSLAVFAAGFIMRPFGGIVFGYVGDRFGRKAALKFASAGMTISTLAIGLIPTYHQSGVFAPMYLVGLRLMQGLCISGEGAGTAIFALEHSDNFKPGFITALVHSSNMIGTILASLVGIAIEFFLPQGHNSWRIAFVLGGLFGFLVFHLRATTQETPIFQTIKDQRKKHLAAHRVSFSNIIKKSWRAVILTFFVGATSSSVVYLVKTYVNIFYNNVMHIDQTRSLAYLTYTSAVLMMSMPYFGFLSDKVGKDVVLRYATTVTIILITPVLNLMSCDSLILQIIALTALGTMSGSITGVSYIFVISLFKPEERYLGVGFSYNLGIAVFGSTSPMIARWLVGYTGLFYSPGFYIITIAGAFLLIKSRIRART